MMILPLLLVIQTALAQMNGEFWWLNEKVAALKGTRSPSVVYGDLNDLGTDETDRVIFKDYDETETNERTEERTKQKEVIDNDFVTEVPTPGIFFPETETTTRKSYHTEVQSSNNDELIFKDVFHYNASTRDMKITNSQRSNHTDVDEMKLIFPMTENITLEQKFKNHSTANENSIKSDTHTIDETGSKKQEVFKTNVENICTSLTINQCKRQRGTIYYKPATSTKHINGTHFKICCILPIIMKETSSRMIFPDEINSRVPRRKRGAQTLNDRDSKAKKEQRSFLFNIRIIRPLSKLPTSSIRPLRKIVTPDYEYEDPYWNIKNTKVETATEAQHDYLETDYDEDFVSELPKPGKLGSYPRRNSNPVTFKWASSNGNKGNTKNGGNGYNGDSYYDYDPVIDDRSEHNSKAESSISDVDDYMLSEEDNEIDPFVSYTADPDFQVLEGFKLLNLIPKFGTNSGNNNKPVMKTPNKCEAKSSEDNSDEEIGLVKLYKDCDKGRNHDYDTSGDADVSGETKPGSQPWLALVIRKMRPRRILCYAVLIHPRAAVTVADCIQGLESEDIELTIGQWDLSDGHSQSQRRTVTTYTDPNYRPNTLDQSLAILHWNTPLRIDKNVHPICMTDLKANDDSCSFVGWGGKGQELLSRPSREHASLLGGRECSRRLSGQAPRAPRGALCAVVESQRVVTDVGGGLFCSRGKVQSVAAIVIWSESKPRSPLLLQPVDKWVKEAFKRIVFINN